MSTVTIQVRQELLDRLSEFQRTGEYSDLTIACKDEEFAAHRVIVCSHSDFFRAACGGSFVESKSKRVSLPEEDAVDVKRMINYMYSFNLDEIPAIATDNLLPTFEPEETQSTEHEDSAIDISTFQQDDDDQGSTPIGEDRGNKTENTGRDENVFRGNDTEPFGIVKSYALAEQYQMTSMKDLAQSKFREWALTNYLSPRMPAITREVFESTQEDDMGLRTIICDVVVDNLALMIKLDSWKDLVASSDQLCRMLLEGAVNKYLDTAERATKSDLAVQSHERDRILLVQKFSSVLRCRQCRIDFNVYLQTNEGATLHCRKCHVRH